MKSGILGGFSVRTRVLATMLGASCLRLLTFLLAASVAEAADLPGGPLPNHLDCSGSPYTVTSSITVPVGQSTVIDPGCVLKFNSGTKLEVSGTLSATSTIFTSAAASPSPGSWGGIGFGSGSSGNLQTVTIRYAGGLPQDFFGTSASTNLFTSTSNVTINSGTITDSMGDGLLISGTGTAPNVTNNTFTGNQQCAIRLKPADAGWKSTNTGNNSTGIGTDGICADGNITTNTVWPNSGLPFFPESNPVGVLANKSLTVEPNVVIKGKPNRALFVSGTLNATGTTFTSASTTPQPGGWSGVGFGTGSSGQLNGVEISYGGACTSAFGPTVCANLFMASSNVRISNRRVIYSNADGILVSGAGPIVEGSQIFRNTRGIAFLSGGTGLVSRTSFLNNSDTAVFADSSSFPNLGVFGSTNPFAQGFNNF